MNQAAHPETTTITTTRRRRRTLKKKNHNNTTTTTAASSSNTRCTHNTHSIDQHKRKFTIPATSSTTTTATSMNLSVNNLNNKITPPTPSSLPLPVQEASAALTLTHPQGESMNQTKLKDSTTSSLTSTLSAPAKMGEHTLKEISIASQKEFRPESNVNPFLLPLDPCKQENCSCKLGLQKKPLVEVVHDQQTPLSSQKFSPQRANEIMDFEQEEYHILLCFTERMQGRLKEGGQLWMEREKGWEVAMFEKEEEHQGKLMECENKAREEIRDSRALSDAYHLSRTEQLESLWKEKLKVSEEIWKGRIKELEENQKMKLSEKDEEVKKKMGEISLSFVQKLEDKYRESEATLAKKIGDIKLEVKVLQERKEEEKKGEIEMVIKEWQEKLRRGREEGEKERKGYEERLEEGRKIMEEVDVMSRGKLEKLKKEFEIKTKEMQNSTKETETSLSISLLQCEAKLKEFSGTITTLQTKLQDVERTLEEKDKRLTALVNNLIIKDARIEEMQKTIAQKDLQLDEVREERTKDIARLGNIDLLEKAGVEQKMRIEAMEQIVREVEGRSEAIENVSSTTSEDLEESQDVKIGRMDSNLTDVGGDNADSSTGSSVHKKSYNTTPPSSSYSTNTSSALTDQLNMQLKDLYKRLGTTHARNVSLSNENARLKMQVEGMVKVLTG